MSKPTKIDQFFSPQNKINNKRRRNLTSPDSLTNTSKRTTTSSTNISDTGITKMNTEQLKTFLSEILDEKLKYIKTTIAKVATKEDISLLNSKLEKVIIENNQLKNTVNNLKHECKGLRKELEIVQNKQKINNLVFRGLEQNFNDDCTKIITDIFKTN